jgi:hypothetical protein
MFWKASEFVENDGAEINVSAPFCFFGWFQSAGDGILEPHA